MTCVVSILFMGGHVYPSVFAQSSEDNYILPVILVYPAVSIAESRDLWVDSQFHQQSR